MSKIIQEKKGLSSVEMEVMFLLALIVIFGLIAKPLYKKYIIEPKAKEGFQILSEIVSYVEEYDQTHPDVGGWAGEDSKNWPAKNCDTEKANNEWIDKIMGAPRRAKWFDFYYVVGPDNNVSVSAVGRASPFSESDTLRYYFANDTWQATGYLQEAKPK